MSNGFYFGMGGVPSVYDEYPDEQPILIDGYELDLDTLTAGGELRTIKEQIKELQEQEKAVASRVILAIGEKTGLTIGGQKAVTFKAQNSSRFSSTAFKKEHPDLYADFVQTTSTRILRLA